MMDRPGNFLLKGKQLIDLQVGIVIEFVETQFIVVGNRHGNAF
jgi:hypothetical protein